MSHAGITQEVKAKLEAGRRAIADGLRRLADRIETLPLQDAAEGLAWFGDQLQQLKREAERIFDRK